MSAGGYVILDKRIPGLGGVRFWYLWLKRGILKFIDRYWNSHMKINIMLPFA